LYCQWREKLLLTHDQLKEYHQFATNFGKIWKALGWKVFTWVHWVVRHSSALADLHKNFFVFSSIPTERRNVEFKLDVKHCFKGWKISDPKKCKFGFAVVLNLSALDKGLMLYDARRRGKKRERDDFDLECPRGTTFAFYLLPSGISLQLFPQPLRKIGASAYLTLAFF
jgi:hypothetical protein